MTEYEADRRKYYTYVADQVSEWWVKTPPRRNLDFERELEAFGGLNLFGQPKLRVRWAGTLLSDVAAKETLKYKKIWRKRVFCYKDEKGTHRVDRADAAPKGAIVQALDEEHELGRLRWVIEAWQSTADAVRGGRFNSQTRGEDGQLLFRSPPPDGVYNAFFFVETADGYFRDLDNEVLEAVKGLWHYQREASDEQKLADLTDDQETIRKQGNTLASAQWN